MTPNDPGPIYTETLLALHAASWPVEPWNTWSNLIFVAILLDISVRTKLNYKRYPLIVFSLPVLTVGLLGGTVYHATRSHVVWLILDFMPILLLTSAAAIAYWKALVGSTPKAVCLFLLVAVSGRTLAWTLNVDRSIKISLSYAAAALAILIPIFLIARRRTKTDRLLVAGITLTFASAVAFRMFDRPIPGIPHEPLLPMGTHFLWHLLGGAAVWLLMILTIRLRDTQAS